LSPDDHAKLKAALDTLAFLTAELQTKQTSLDRLRRLLFGATTEKTRALVGPGAAPGAPGSSGRASVEGGPAAAPPPGHGRTGAAAYTGADTVKVPHPARRRGDHCPGCPKGKIYPLAEPATLVRITGMAPLGATVYACDRWRWHLCGEVFTAPAPDGVGDAKYDATATTMVGLLKYGCGLPFHRIETLQRAMRIPLPAATQWELVRDALPPLVPAWDELLRHAAQGEVVYNDDTTMKVLALTAEQRRAAAADEETDARTGVFTSGIVATRAGHRIALFFTGRPHAGENLAAVLAQRAADLAPPIQMCDALATNTAGAFDTLLARCLAHARRRFVDVVDHFPTEVQHVLETLREVYRTDALARAVSAADRLDLHQTASGPLMAGLEAWLRQRDPVGEQRTSMRLLAEAWRVLAAALLAGRSDRPRELASRRCGEGRRWANGRDVVRLRGAVNMTMAAALGAGVRFSRFAPRAALRLHALAEEWSREEPAWASSFLDHRRYVDGLTQALGHEQGSLHARVFAVHRAIG